MRPGSSQRPLAAAIAALVTAVPAWAQDDQQGGATRLDNIEVVRNQEQEPLAEDFGYVGQSSNTATKTNVPISETPRSISVVTREQLDDRASVSLSDALHYAPGLQSGYFGQDNKQDWFIVRGFKQANNGLYRDGTRINSSGFYSYQIDTFGLDRVEILRGPASVLYGQTPPGGVINVISKRPLDEEFGLVDLQVGSFNHRQLGLDVGGVLNDDMSYRVVTLVRGNGTQVDGIKAERQLFAPSLKWNMTDDTELTLLGSFQRDDSDPYLQFLPSEGTLTESVNGRIGDNVAVGNPNFEKFERTQILLGYQLSHDFNDQLNFQQSVRYGHLDIDLQQAFFTRFSADFPNIVLPPATTLGQVLDPAGARRTIVRQVSTSRGNSDSFNADNRFNYVFKQGKFEHNILAGFDFQFLDIDDRDFAADPILADGNQVVPGLGVPDPRFDIFNPQYTDNSVLLNSTTFQPLTDDDRLLIQTRARQYGLYLQEQLTYDDQLKVLLGARFDSARNDIDNPNQARQKVDNDELTLNGGLAYIFRNGVTAYGSYAEFFQPIVAINPSTQQPFDPEEGDQFEIGVKYQPPGFDGYFNAAAFQLTQENLRQFVNSVPSQLGEVESRGVEFEAVANITPALSLIANATLLDVEIQKSVIAGQEGKRPSQLADRLASIWANYRFIGGSLNGFSIGAGARYVGETFGDNTETQRVPSFTLYDMTMAYAWDDFKVQVAAKNLTDKEYIATCSFFCYYGNRRNITASLSYEW